jgi:hypothetical protein
VTDAPSADDVPGTRELENKMFEELGKGYQGATVDKGGRKYKFVGDRGTSVHGLFGEIRYQRAYYVSTQGEGESWIPLDEQRGIEKRIEENRPDPGLLPRDRASVGDG